jgi:hypothetical protein
MQQGGDHVVERTIMEISKKAGNIDINAPEKSGILKKRKMMFWEERWFELKKPGVLTRYKRSPDHAALENRRSSTDGRKSEELARNHIDLQDVLTIGFTPPSCNISIEVEGRKTYELFAAGEDLAAEWYAALVPWLKKRDTSLALPLPPSGPPCTISSEDTSESVDDSCGSGPLPTTAPGTTATTAQVSAGSAPPPRPDKKPKKDNDADDDGS